MTDQPEESLTFPPDYFIKPGYQHREVALTNNRVSGKLYWTDKRIRTASEYQYSVYDLAIRLVSERRTGRLVDVGCGIGVKLGKVAAAHPDLEIVGLDQAETIDVCRQIHDFGTWVADDFDRPDPAMADIAPADMVICSDVIEHVASPDRLIAYIKGKLRCDGVLILSTPERDVLRGKANMRSPKREHVREWNRMEMTRLLEFAGFQILDWQLHYPVRPRPSQAFFHEVYAQLRSLRSVRYNQVFVAQQRQ